MHLSLSAVRPPALPETFPVVGVQVSSYGSPVLGAPELPPPSFVKHPAASESACWGNTKGKSSFVGAAATQLSHRQPPTLGSPSGIYHLGRTIPQS